VAGVPLRGVEHAAGLPGGDAGPAAPLVGDLLLEPDDPLQQRLGPRRAARDVDVDRDDLVDALGDGVRVPVRPTGVGAGTDERGGAKFATMDVIGLPWQLIVGPKGLERGVVELKNRRTGEREELSAESALARLSA
jgi:hypothetical protein